MSKKSSHLGGENTFISYHTITSGTSLPVLTGKRAGQFPCLSCPHKIYSQIHIAHQIMPCKSTVAVLLYHPCAVRVLIIRVSAPPLHRNQTRTNNCSTSSWTIIYSQTIPSQSLNCSSNGALNICWCFCRTQQVLKFTPGYQSEKVSLFSARRFEEELHLHGLPAWTPAHHYHSSAALHVNDRPAYCFNNHCELFQLRVCANLCVGIVL